MNVSDLIKAVIDLADDALPPAEIVSYLNDAMAKVNVEVNANFPFLDINEPTQEPIFPEKWQRLLLVIFAAGRVKQKDSSQFEYNDLYNQFYTNLADFKVKYTVPEEYQDLESSSNVSVKPDFTGNYYLGDW